MSSFWWTCPSAVLVAFLLFTASTEIFLTSIQWGNISMGAPKHRTGLTDRTGAWLSFKWACSSRCSLVTLDKHRFNSSIRVGLQPVTGLRCWQRLFLSSTLALAVPLTHLCTIGDWAFLVAAARTWNSLASKVTYLQCLQKFKTKLTQDLFLFCLFPIPCSWL